MDKSFFVMECKTEEEYAEILALLAMYQIKPFKIVDDLQKLSSCSEGKPEECSCAIKPHSTGTSSSSSSSGSSPIKSPILHEMTPSCKVSVHLNELENIEACRPIKIELESNLDSSMCSERPIENLGKRSEMSCIQNCSTPLSNYPSSFDIYKKFNTSLNGSAYDDDLKPSETSIYSESQNVKSEFDRSASKRRRRDASMKRFHEFVLELLVDPRYEHLIHFSGSSKSNIIQFTIPDRRKLATVWGLERDDPNYSSTFLVNKDFWNAQKAGIFTRVLFQDPMLIYKIEPNAESRFIRVLKERDISMADVHQLRRSRLSIRGEN